MYIDIQKSEPRETLIYVVIFIYSRILDYYVAWLSLIGKMLDNERQQRKTNSFSRRIGIH